MAGKIDLSKLYENDEAWEKAYNEIANKVKEYKNYEGHLYDSKDNLYNFFEFDTSVSKELEKLYLYAHINNDLDLSNSKYQEYYGKMMILFETIENSTSFVIPEILSKDYDFYQTLSKENPKLLDYELVVKRIFRNKPFTKSKEEEALISTLTTSYHKPEEISEMLINTDLKYAPIKDENDKEVELTNSNYSKYFESSNRRVRKDAFISVYNAFKEHNHTLGTILATEVMNNNRIAKIRNFESSRALSLYHNEINNDIYDKLINGVHNNLDKFYKYYDLKKSILDLKDFHVYDTYANITKKYNKEYSYDEAKDIILDSLKVLGNDYINNLKVAFEDNWIDASICKTKRSGGYCTAAYYAHPYVVISYENKLNDISTLAHELGHAMHFDYAIKNNDYQYYEYSIFVAEVASQVNEIILTDYLYKKSTDIEEKRYLLDLIIQRFKATIVRQTMFAEYEDIIHKLEASGNVLTPETLENEYLKLVKLYFGPSVEIDDYMKFEAYRIPHFYYNFYVYQYATGYAAALKIAADIINDKKDAKENYIKFLSLGCTKDPIESLKVAGIDIENEKIYDEVFEVFEDKLKELRSLYE